MGLEVGKKSVALRFLDVVLGGCMVKISQPIVKLRWNGVGGDSPVDRNAAIS